MAVALLTDFGTKDYFVGAMKGVIMSIAPNETIVDITHEISPQDIRAAAFTLKACYFNFPEKTIFVAVVDPGVGSERRAIVVKTEKYFFIAPDNGLLSLVLDKDENFEIFELTNERYFNIPVSNTFHGRDIFAPVAAHISTGVDIREFGAKTSDIKDLDSQRPRSVNGGEIEGEIIHIDHFGNLITNIRREDIPGFFRVQIKNETIGNIVEYYADTNKGELGLIFGSAGFLEIVVFEGSAQELLDVGLGRKVLVKL